MASTTSSNNIYSSYAEGSIQDGVILKYVRLEPFRCRKYTDTSTLTRRAPDVSPWIEREIAKHDQPLVGPPSSESSIIEQATTHAEDDDIKTRLPYLVCSSEVHNVTKVTGDELRTVGPGSAHNLRAVVFVRPDPITSLQGKDFLLAWVDCVKCTLVCFFEVGCDVSY